MTFTILDTFPDFLRYWETVRLEPIERQIDAWQAVYLAPWPELGTRQIEDYCEQGLDWREVAGRFVFPFLDDRLSDMQRARDGLASRLASIDARARRSLQVDFEVTYILHVGLGCGAGWATSYGGRPAVLFGLENAAEEGMVEAESLDRLAAHEFSHLAHRHWRQLAGLDEGHGPWWQLVEEGLARRAEARILGDVSPPSEQLADDWEDWCRANRAWLAEAFLETIRSGEPVNCFFGSWLEVGGRSETGYYLGEQVVREWERSLALEEIAQLEASMLEVRARASLEAMARTGEKARAHRA